MPRSSRLLALMQCLRRHRQPVTAARLADELSVSGRTIYRDIGALRAEGAPIEGEAGIGYVLRRILISVECPLDFRCGSFASIWPRPGHVHLPLNCSQLD